MPVLDLPITKAQARRLQKGLTIRLNKTAVSGSSNRVPVNVPASMARKLSGRLKRGRGFQLRAPTEIRGGGPVKESIREYNKARENEWNFERGDPLESVNLSTGTFYKGVPVKGTMKAGDPQIDLLYSRPATADEMALKGTWHKDPHRARMFGRPSFPRTHKGTYVDNLKRALLAKRRAVGNTDPLEAPFSYGGIASPVWSGDEDDEEDDETEEPVNEAPRTQLSIGNKAARVSASQPRKRARFAPEVIDLTGDGIGQAFKRFGKATQRGLNTAVREVKRRAPGVVKQVAHETGRAAQQAKKYVPRAAIKGAVKGLAMAATTAIGQPELAPLIQRAVNPGIDAAYDTNLARGSVGKNFAKSYAKHAVSDGMDSLFTMG